MKLSEKKNVGGTKGRVCHLSSVHQQLDSRVFYRECLSLAQAGYNVSLICPCGKNEVIECVSIINYLRWKSRLLRIIFSPFIIMPALKQKADLYHFHAVELIPTGLILRVLFRKRVIYDVHEDFPSMMAHKQYIPGILRPAMSKAVHWAEQASTRIFDGVVTADPGVFDTFPAVPSNRKMIFYNLPSLDIFRDFPSGPQEKPYDIVYLGGMSERAGTFILIKAIEQVVRSGLKPRVLLMGYFDNPEAEEGIRRETERARLSECFDIRGRVPHQEVPKLLSQARIGVVPLQPVPKFLKNIPSKLFEYWACGLPAVASDLPPIRPFFKDREYGLLVDPIDPKGFADAFCWLMTNTDQAEKMGQHARKAVFEKFNCSVEGEKLAHFYRQILGNGGGRA